MRREGASGSSGDERWLLVSKPLVPPLCDGSTVLAHALVSGLPSRFTVAYFGAVGGDAPPVREVGGRVIPAGRMGYAPTLGQKASMLSAMLSPRFGSWPLHVMFTPNQVTSNVLRLLARCSPSRPIVQTVTSSHGVERHVRALAGLGAVVVGSERTRGRLLRAGLSSERLHTILPGIELPAAPPSTEDLAARTSVLYAGDLDPEVLVRLREVARQLQSPELRAFRLVAAVRLKRPAHRALVVALEHALRELLPERHVLFGEVADMRRLYREAALQLFLASHVKNKVDLPLVLLEGLAHGVPILGLEGGPVAEIVALGEARGLGVGVEVPTTDVRAALGAILRDSERRVGFGQASSVLAEREFSRSRMVARYVELYDAVTQARRGST